MFFAEIIGKLLRLEIIEANLNTDSEVVSKMESKKFKQADYMALQLMEIENFRQTLSHQSHEPITFQEAVMLWVSEGFADEFKSEFSVKRGQVEPAFA